MCSLLENTKSRSDPGLLLTVSKTHTFPAHTLSPVVTMLSSSHAPAVVRKRAQCSLSLTTFSPATCLNMERHQLATIDYFPGSSACWLASDESIRRVRKNVLHNRAVTGYPYSK